MICFRDRSYCSYSEQCDNNQCDRKFTQQDSLDAKRWWGSDSAPVAYMSFKTADCGFKQKEPIDEK